MSFSNFTESTVVAAATGALVAIIKETRRVPLRPIAKSTNKVTIGITISLKNEIK